MSQEPRRPHLEPLTGLRFFAAFAIVVHHCFGGVFQALPQPFQNLQARGFVGVSLFFILSGFILSYNYMREGGELAGGRSRFYVARFARIYPIYVLGLIIALPTFVIPILAKWPLPLALAKISAIALLTLSLTQAWVPQAAILWNGPGWSLSAEAFFYAVFPWIAAWVYRRSAGQAYGLMAALWLVSNAVVAGFPQGDALLLGCNPLLRLPEFVMGIAAARVFERGRHRGSVLLAGGSVALVALLLAFLPRGFDPLIRNALLAPLFVVLILGLARTRLSSPVLGLLGEASYSLYIFHLPFWVVVTLLGAHWLPMWALLTGFTLFIVALSAAALKAIEVPARKRLAAWLNQLIAQVLPAWQTAGKVRS